MCVVGLFDGFFGIVELNLYGDKVDELYIFVFFYGILVDDNELVVDGEFEWFVGVDVGG